MLMDYPPVSVEQGVATLTLVVVVLGTLLGAALWMFGWRLSRTLVTLTGVAAGAVLGREMPDSLGWSISGMGPAVAGALLLGVVAFVLHRVWLAIVLGTVLAGWMALATCMVTVPQETWAWPAICEESTARSLAGELWDVLPAGTREMLPYAAGIGLLSGIGLMIRWPRMGTALAYSTLGVSLLAVMGLSLLELINSRWLAVVPQQHWSRIGTVAGLAVAGAVVQWVFMPVSRPRAPKKEEVEAAV
jgi:hypothetical protein